MGVSFTKNSVSGALLLLATVSQSADARVVAHAAACLKSPGVKVAPELSAYQQEKAITPAQLILRWQPLVARASHRAGVPVAWINAVMRVESGGRNMLTDTQPMISSKGALGLMQVLPQTYRDMRAQYKLGPNPFEPKDNIGAGAGYLRRVHGKYGYPAMFAAYSAGPGRVDDVLGGHKQLPAETQSYVARVAAVFGEPSDGALINAVTFAPGWHFGVD